MLQSNILSNDRVRPLLDGGASPEHSNGGGLEQIVTFALGFIKRQYPVIVFMTVLAVMASGVYLKGTPPTYTAQTKVLLGNPKAAFVQQQAVLAEAPIDAVQIETQLQLIRSNAVAVAVIDKLKLVDDPDFKSSGRFHKIFQRIRGWFSTTPPEEPKLRVLSPDQLVDAFEDRLKAGRVGISNVIEISFSASDPVRAAEITNAIADAYINDQLNAKFEANRSATAWLQGRLRELGQQALTAERAVAAFKSDNNIVASGGRLIDDQQVGELNSRLVAARAQTADVLARVTHFDEILRANAPNSTSIGTLDASGTDALGNPIITTLRQQYLEYARREAEWSTRFGKDHLAVVNLRNRMRDLRTSIFDEVRRLAETARSDLEVAKQRQQQLEQQLAQAVAKSRTANSAELTMRELETSAKSYRSLYESFLQKYMGSVQQESFPISETRVISPASPPSGKSKPKTGLIMALGLFGGIALGAGLGLLRDLMDRVFRLPAQVESALQLPCISVVPLLKTSPEPPRRKGTSHQNDVEPVSRTISRRSATYWAASTMPLSRFAESIRAIKLALDLTPTKTSNKIVGITSSLPNEGKSTIVASLAQLIAHAGRRVIVVDCDLRNPSLSENLAPGTTAGIIEVISGAKPLEEAIWRDPKTNLALLPVAKKTPLFHTSETLSADQTRKLFDKLRATYDYIIVDLPPLAPIVDVRATTPLIDCFVLVVEWGKTKIDVVQHALHTAPNVHDALIGSVLNKTDMKALKQYDSYKNDYYNSEHYTRYGYIQSEG